MKAALAERQRIAAPVPKDLLELYERIAKRHNGTAMAQVRDDQCRGCGMRVLPHIIQELRQETNEEIYRCEMCGLILYTLDPIPVANSGPGSGSDKSSATSAINP
jgi:predicted  nucleic acid-binding Zn-ribbon protein